MDKTASAEDRRKYQVFRDYRNGEHNLINFRLTWFLTIQGFLWTAYGFSIQKLAEVEAKIVEIGVEALTKGQSIPGTQGSGVDFTGFQAAETQLKVLISIIPWVGGGISVAALVGISAALLALWSLKRKWNSIDANAGKNDCWLPDAGGGGNPLAGWLGILFPGILPFVILCGWCVVWHYLALSRIGVFLP